MTLKKMDAIFNDIEKEERRETGQKKDLAEKFKETDIQRVKTDKKREQGAGTDEELEKWSMILGTSSKFVSRGGTADNFNIQVTLFLSAQVSFIVQLLRPPWRNQKLHLITPAGSKVAMFPPCRRCQTVFLD